MERAIYVTASQCGYDGNLSLTGIFEILQDAVTVECKTHGMDNITLKNKYNSMWVFSKNKVRVYKRPTWEQKLKINSRIVKANKLICYYKTNVTDLETNELLFEGLVECCILDKTTFKFVRLSSFNINYTEEDCDTNYEFNNENENIEYSFVVKESIIDMSMHLNNAKAFYPLMDALGKEELNKYYNDKFEIGIKYQHQAMLDSNLKISLNRTDEYTSFSFINDENETIDLGYLKKF